MDYLKRSSICIFAVYLAFFTIIPSALSQTRQIDAGARQFVNWEENHTAQLGGSVTPAELETSWSCPANPGVQFDDPGNPETTATFPRPGYYLLRLAGKDTNLSDTVVMNVFRSHSYEHRLSDLVQLMTIGEKISQLSNQTDSIPRLNVPAYNYWSEALHGVLDRGVTSFPQAVAMGSTWDPDLVRRVATAISDEARVLHMTRGKGLTYWSPTVNIARDPRWGRNEESYSEDPYLLSRMGVAFVQGMQGDHPYYLKTVATPKHFIANNEERRRHSGSSDVDMRSLWEYYMPAFERTIVEGGAYSIMGAYNELNHVPATGNYFLLTDVLRREWGFDGYVVSDCGAINDMVNGHHFFETGPEAVARGILAGCDLNCGTFYRRYLQEALDLGLLAEQDLDSALTRVLSARFRLGEFDPPELVPYNDIAEDVLDSQEHRELALEAARKSIVLLKNDGLLPLDSETVESIAVIGPNAAELELGIYSGWPNVQVSPLDGIKSYAAEHGIAVEYAQGSGIGGGLLKPVRPQHFGEIAGTGKTGLQAEFFDNMELQGEPVYTRIDSMVNFAWGGGSPAPGVPADQFSVRWTGTIIPPETRVYQLGTRTDDGARLYVNGELLFEDWTEHGEKPNSAEIKLEAGKEYEIIFEQFDNTLGSVARLVWDLGQTDFSAARDAASGKDAVILVLGLTPGLSEEELDRTTIALPEIQRQLIREVAKVNSNIAVVLINGGPVAMLGTEEIPSALIEAWYTGQSTGTAIADVLFGEANPGGKLPETFYASTEQLPPFADYDLINNERTYMYFDQPVLYPFGHGLSYTTFRYSNLKLSTDTIDRDESIRISCNVQNVGDRQGDEVVQLYVTDSEATVKVPVRQLKRFQRVTLSPGESNILSFTLPASDLAFYDIDSNEFMVEPGRFKVGIGSSSEDIRLNRSFMVE